MLNPLKLKSGPAGLLTVAVLINGVVNAADFGRFFTTPEQRQQLQALRFAPPVQAVEPVPEPEPEPQPEPLPQVEAPTPPPIPGINLNGFVTRKQGKSTVWVNGQNSSRGDLDSQYLDIQPVDRRNQKVPVTIRINDKGLSLKPGQRYVPDSDAVVETYQGRALKDRTEDLAPEG